MKRIAVVLLNLGGPDSREAIEPFLRNFFSDPAIIPLPGFLREALAWIIARKRTHGAADASYAELGYVSPILDNTKAQARSLAQVLKQNSGSIRFGVFTCMRYWRPRARQVMDEIEKFNPDLVVLLPMYPQFSTTTSGSSFREWEVEAKRAGLNLPSGRICCYFENEGFTSSCATAIDRAYNLALAKDQGKPKLILSAHGLPEYVVRSGDPYIWQCEQTAKAIIGKSGIENPDWTLSFQSRVGPAKWVKPDTRDVIIEAAKQKRPIVIHTPAFVSDHVETLVEIDIEYRKLAEDNGSPFFIRVPVAGTDPVFIKAMADLVLGELSKAAGGEKNRKECDCAGKFKKCPAKPREALSDRTHDMV